MRLSVIGVFLALSLGAAAQQGGKHKLMPGQGIDWKGDWEAALKEARARNVPVMFAVHKDG